MGSERISWLANGIDLHSEQRGWSLQRPSSVRVARSVRRSVVSVAGSHGARRGPGLPVYDEASVTLQWLLSGGGSQAALRDAYEHLVGLLQTPRLTLGLRTDGSVVEAPASLSGITEPVDFLVGRHMRVDATFFLDDPFLRDQAFTTTGLLDPGTHTLAGLGGSAPISDAVVRFSGPTAQVSVVDAGSGSSLSWTGTVNAGQYVYLHPDTMRARRSGSASQWDSGGTDVSAAVEYAPPGRLQLWPMSGETSPGVLRRQVQVATSGGPCMIRGKRAWL